MTDTITLTGIIATDPRALRTQAGLAITSFRLASSQRRYDRVAAEWVDGDTNWYTVTAFRQLAENVHASVAKGQRVIVTGRLRVRSWESGDRSGITVEVDADAIGHDLVWGRSTFERRVVTSAVSAESANGADAASTSTSASTSAADGSASPDPHPSDETTRADGPSDRDGAVAPSDGVDAPHAADDSGSVPAGDAEWGTPPALTVDEMPVPF